MKTFKQNSTEILIAITCDCCKRNFTKDDYGFYEIQSISFEAGYGSIFGDGNTVSIDICQECLKEKLGKSLRVTIAQPSDADQSVFPKKFIHARPVSAEEPNSQITSVESLKGLLKPPLAQVLIESMSLTNEPEDQFHLYEEWDIGRPVGIEFGADSARFMIALQRAISVFGNVLDAIKWITAFNRLFEGTPMKGALESEDGLVHILEVLSEIEMRP